MRRTISLVISTILIVAPAVMAQTKVPPAAPSPITKKKAPKKVTGVRKGGFSLDKFEQSMFDKRAQAIQARMSAIRKRKIQSLMDIIKSNRPYRNKADVLFRLAEAYWSEAKYQYLLNRDRYDKAYDCWEEKRCTAKPTEPVEDFSVSLNYYRQVLREFPTYRRIDEVMYYLGRAALKAGKARKDSQLQKEGVKYLDDLVQLHSKSRFVSNSYLALAEHFFDRDMLTYAKNKYEKIIFNFPRSPMFNYALYKLGWVYFNLGEFEKTVKTFKRVVAAIGKGRNRARIEFRDQALRDLVIVWVEIDNGWREARAYFMKEVGEKDTYSKLEKMAGLLVSKDKDNEAIDLYNHLIGHYKIDAKVVEFFDAIMEVRMKANLPTQEKEINRMVVYFDKKGPWQIANKQNSEVVDRADAMISKFVYYLANSHHRLAQAKEKKRLPTKPSYRSAAHYYKMFLDRFPDHKRAYVLNFYYAEILFHELDNYEKAATQYEAVISKEALISKGNTGTYLEEAAEGVVFCMERLMVRKGLKEGGSEKLTLVKKKRTNANLKANELKLIPRTPLHSLEKRYIRAADTYVRLIRTAMKKDPNFQKKYKGRGTKIPNMMYIAAQTFYRHGEFRDAVERLMVIFELYPQHRIANIAVNNIIDAYARLKHWEKIEEWARKLIRTKNFKVKKKGELEDMIAFAKAEHARDLTKQRRYKDAIKIQLELVDEFGRSNKELAAKALYNIAVIYETSRDFEQAVKAYEDVIKRYKKQPVAIQAQFDIGVLYESQTRFAEAAAAFIKMKAFKSKSPKKCAEFGPKVATLSEKHPSRKARPKRGCADDAIRNAGLLYSALEMYSEANNTLDLYVKLFKSYFKSHSDVPEVAFHSADVLQRQKDPKALERAAKAFKKIAGSFGRKDLQYKLRATAAGAIALKKADPVKNRRKATGRFKAALKIWAKLTKNPEDIKGLAESTKAYAGQCSLELAEYSYTDYAKLKIVGLDSNGKFSVKLLKKTLIAKGKGLTKTQAAFDEVLSFKDPGIAAASAFRVGQLYYEFADSLFNADVPPQLNEEQRDQYRIQLEKFARPIQEKALKTFTMALKNALTRGVYNQWSRMSAKYTAKVNPDEFPISEFRAKPNKTKDTVQSTSFIRTVRRGDVVVDFTK